MEAEGGPSDSGKDGARPEGDGKEMVRGGGALLSVSRTPARGRVGALLFPDFYMFFFPARGRGARFAWPWLPLLFERKLHI